jgi:membrane associated rhomboid family serine protease
VVLTAAGYLAGLFWLPFAGHLAAIPELVLPGLQLWRLLTWPVVVIGVWNVLFGLLLFWTFGSELEPEWGTRRYASFLLAATAAGAVLGTGAALLLGGEGLRFFGPSSLLTALILAWALRGPSAPVSFFGVLPMTRGVFGLVAVGLAVFGELDATVGHPWSVKVARLVFALGGIPVAWLFSRRRGSPGGGGWRGPSRLLRKRRFTVVEGSRDWRVH